MYVSAEDGSFLGMYEIAETMMCDRHNDAETIKLSGISREEFYKLFPHRRGFKAMDCAYRHADQ